LARFGTLHGEDAARRRRVGTADGVHDAIGVGRVRHHVEDRVVDPPHDDVVEHRPGFVEEVRVLRAPGADLAQVVGQRLLQMIEGAGAVDAHCTEVTDVEDHGARATGAVLVQGPGRIGDRHQPPAELDQLGSKGAVRVFQRRVSKPVCHAAPTLRGARADSGVNRALKNDAVGFRLRQKRG
jgi:hypothetical protein